MVKVIVFDFSRVLLFAREDGYQGGLNDLHRGLKAKEDYSLLDYFRLNEELLRLAEKLANSFDLYLFTTGTIQDEPELKERLKGIFKEVFTVIQIGFTKHDPQAYQLLTTKIGVDPNKILFVDDTLANVEAAKKAGWQVLQYQSNQQLASALEVALNQSAG